MCGKSKAWFLKSHDHRKTCLQRCFKEDFKAFFEQLQIFLVKDRYLRSLQQCGDQAISRQLKKHVHKHVLAILTVYMETQNSMENFQELKQWIGRRPLPASIETVHTFKCHEISIIQCHS